MLHREVVAAPSLEVFKARLDSGFEQPGLVAERLEPDGL